MDQDRRTTLFFEIFHTGLLRHGPGDAASTARALAMVPTLSTHSRVLDMGCGCGAQTLVLAERTDAHILALDSHEPSIDELTRRAAARGLGNRIEARVGDIRHPDVLPGSVDLIWSEGAIYNIGFEEGLRLWGDFLAPGGHLAVTEACWTQPDPPAECVAFWEREYPVIRDVAERLHTIEACGYNVVGHFTLPASSWWDEYYQPLETSLTKFRERHRGEVDADEVAESIEREIDTWRRYSDFYGYEFFVMKNGSRLGRR